MKVKFCTKCERDLPATTEYFYKRERNKDGLREWCKECCRKKSAKYKRDWRKNNPKLSKEKRKAEKLKKYNLTVDEYNKIFKDQSGKCAICGIHQSKLDYSLCVDHDHTSKEVRGLLCFKCNWILGYSNDNGLLLIKATKYLQNLG